MNRMRRQGFTLIELSIVLVIIGLIVGGVLVGRDLVSAATVRSQITQIEQVQTAVNTFKGKYGYLPGDISASAVREFGFITVPIRAGTVAEGDGDGIVQGICCTNYVRSNLISGETAWFWADLGNNTKMIPGDFQVNATPSNGCSGPGGTSKMLPEAKLGKPNYITAYNDSGNNYLTLTYISVTDACGTYSRTNGQMPLQVRWAADIDKKMDDGLPQLGNVQAFYSDQNAGGSAPYWSAGGNTGGVIGTGATAGTSLTCYDNNNVSGATQQYSVTQNNGSGMNCALSFKLK